MSLSKNLPVYVVEPTPLPKGAGDMSIIDFGYSFLLSETGPLWGVKDFDRPIGRQPPNFSVGVVLPNGH